MHGDIGFRPVTLSDLPLIYRWLQRPHVKEWYGEGDRTYEETVEHYRSRICGDAPTEAYLIQLDGKPIGYIQAYMISDYPEYSAALDVEEGAAGVDLYIGERKLIHKGLGSTALKAFLSEVVFMNPRTTCCVIGPEPKNLVAIRAYEKAGFTYIKTVRVPGEPEPKYLMRIVKS